MMLVLLLEWYTENMPEKNNCVNSKRIAEEIFKKKCEKVPRGIAGWFAGRVAG